MKVSIVKLFSDIPKPDIAISMGCNVGCPFIGRTFDDNWGIEQIRQNILKLRSEMNLA